MACWQEAERGEDTKHKRMQQLLLMPAPRDMHYQSRGGLWRTSSWGIYLPDFARIPSLPLSAAESGRERERGSEKRDVDFEMMCDVRRARLFSIVTVSPLSEEFCGSVQCHAPKPGGLVGCFAAGLLSLD